MTVDELLQPILNTTAPLRIDDSRETIPEWDSLAQINIIAAIEDVTGAELSTEEVLGIKTVAHVVELCRAHGLDLGINSH
jgi:acyl carrier protein